MEHGEYETNMKRKRHEKLDAVFMFLRQRKDGEELALEDPVMLLNGKWLCCQSCHHQNLQRVYLKIEQYWILYDMLYIYIYIYIYDMI